MKTPVLFRKRIIPDECICLKNDEILYFSPEEHILITRWHALKPREDLHHGYSCYFYDLGFKVSKFYQKDGSLLYWYCDIIHVDYPVNAALTHLSTLLNLIYSGEFKKYQEYLEKYENPKS